MPRSCWRGLLPYVCLSIGWFSLEVLWASLWGTGLPVGPLYGVAALGGLIAVVLGLWGLARWAAVHQTWILPGVVVTVLLGKLYLVAGWRFGLPSVLFVAVPVVLVALAQTWWGSIREDRTGWLAAGVLAVILSTDLIKVLWLWTGRFSVPGYLGLLVLGTVGFWGTVKLGTRLEGGILRHPRATTVVLAAIMASAGLTWGSTHASPILRAGVDPSFEPFFDGSIPSVSSDSGEGSRPNIVLISVDTLRWDMVPPRADHLELDTLERLRRDSLQFDRAFSTSSSTLPAHGSLFSGRLPIEHGGMLPVNRFYGHVPLYPQAMQKLGYRTAAFTDGGLLSRKYGYARGFDLYWQQPRPFDRTPYRDFVPGGLEGIAALLSSHNKELRVEVRHQDSPETDATFYFRRNLRAARKWLERIGRDERFFLFLHTYQVHDYTANPDGPFETYPKNLERLREEEPDLYRRFVRFQTFDPGSDTVFPEEERWEAFRRDPPEGLPSDLRLRYRRRIGELRGRTREYLRGRVGRLKPRERELVQRALARREKGRWESFRDAPFKEQQRLINAALRMVLRLRARRSLKRLYEYGVEAVDRQLGPFLDWLRREGLYRDSVIVFLSDHGEGFKLEADVYRHAQGSLHEVLTRVPIWIKWPDNRWQNRRPETLLQINEVFPLLFRTLGIQVDTGMPVFPRDEWRRPGGGLFLPDRRFVRSAIARRAPWTTPRPLGSRQVKLAVRGTRFKGVEVHEEDPSVFHRVFPDTFVQRSVEPDALPADTHRFLRERLREYRRKHSRFPSPYSRRGFGRDEELRDELKALGYL